MMNDKLLANQIKTIVFDVDGTLTDNVSWYGVTKGLGADEEILRSIFNAMVERNKTYEEAKSELLALWNATGNANKPFMSNMFASWKLKEDAQEIISYLATKYRLCLISGSVDLYIETLAETLKIKDWYANTELIWDEEHNLIDFNYFINQGKKKLEQFNEFCIKYNLKPEECCVVGDSDNDIELFKIAKGIAVNKDKHEELENLALRKIENLIELKKLF